MRSRNGLSPCAPIIIIDERTTACTITDIFRNCAYWTRRDVSAPSRPFGGGDWEPWKLPEFYMSDSPSSQCRCVVVGTVWRRCQLHSQVTEELES